MIRRKDERYDFELRFRSLLTLTNAVLLDKIRIVIEIPIYTEELASVFLPRHRNVWTMRESNF